MRARAHRVGLEGTVRAEEVEVDASLSEASGMWLVTGFESHDATDAHWGETVCYLVGACGDPVAAAQKAAARHAELARGGRVARTDAPDPAIVLWGVHPLSGAGVAVRVPSTKYGEGDLEDEADVSDLFEDAFVPVLL